MSSRSLGQLTIDLVARTGGFVQGMDKAQRESAKWRKQVQRDMQVIGRSAKLATGAAAVATAALVASQVQAATGLRQQAQLSSATTQEFQRYAIAADTVGISQEKLSDQLKDFNEKVGEFQQSGGGGMRDFFEQIAPQIDITADAFRDLSGPQALQLYYDSLEKAGLSQQQMSFYLESMASDTTALIPLLRNGGEGFRLLGDEAERAGAIMSEKTISSAEQLSAAVWVSQQSMAGFRNQIGEKLLPTLADLAVQFSDVATETAIADDVASTLNGTIKGISAAAVGAFASLQLLGRGLGGLLAASEALNKDIPWYDRLSPASALQGMAKNLGAAKDLLVVTGDDLEETAQRYATVLNGIWSAGQEGGGSDDSDNRILKIAEFMKRMREETQAAAGEQKKFDDELKRQEGIQKQIEALQMQSDLLGKTAREQALYKLGAAGADDTQLALADSILKTVEAYEKQVEAQKEAQAALDEQSSAVKAIEDSLRTQEEMIEQSYQTRRDTILAYEEATGKDQTALLTRLEQERQEQLGELNKGYWETYLESAQTAMESMDELVGETLNRFAGGMGDAFEAMIFDAESLEDSVTGLAENMARSIINALGQMAAQWLAYQAVQMLTARTTEAATAVAATATGAAIASAYAPAAAMASLASFGANSAPAMAGIASTTAMAQSMSLMGMAHDGIDSVPQTGTWLLQKGERVTTAETSAKLDSMLDDIRTSGGGRGAVNQTINVTGSVDKKTANQIATSTARKQRLASRRFG